MLLEYRLCYVCGEITPFHDGKCSKCLIKDLKEKERMWEVQDITTKVTDLRKRIEELEHRVYDGPARF